MHCFRLANVVNNATIINTINSNNSNIAKIKTQHHEIMPTVANGILKFEPIIKKPIVTSYKFLNVITFSNIISFAYIDSITIQHFSLDSKRFWSR